MRLLNNLSIKSQLILMLLAISLGSIFVTAYVGYRSGKSNLTDKAFNQLTSIRATKAYQIESYFETIRNHTQVLSEDLMVVAAMQEFKEAYNQLEQAKTPTEFNKKIDTYYQNNFFKRLIKIDESSPILASYTPKTNIGRYLQYYYIAANSYPVGKKHLLNKAGDGSEYSQVHARYHPLFRNIIDKFGYYDMFLIDKTGNIVYTVFKEVDFTTNLTHGPYSESNLAKAFAEVKQAKSTNYVKIVDFEPYNPSYGQPAAFIATPIFNGSEFIGVLAFQLPVDEINNVMTGNQNWKTDGLGDSGETYLVGSDYLMRSVSRFLIQDSENYLKTLQEIGVNEKILQRIQTYNTSILEQEVSTEAAIEALTGKTGTRIIKDYRGIPVLSSYAPLKIDDLKWGIISEIDLAEAYAPVYSFQRTVLILATLMMLLITLAAMWLAYLFVKPINKLIVNAQKIAQGEINTTITSNSKDEFGQLANSFNEMVNSLRHKTKLIEQKNQENEKLLLSIFPTEVAKRLKKGEKDIGESISNVSVLFVELTGFTKLFKSMTVYEMVATLNDLVSALDEATERYGLEKIRTMGESYLAVCGLSIPCIDHDKRTLDLALEMQIIVRRFNHERGFNLDIRSGISSGEVIAGIVGSRKLVYDVWGDTINIASQMKSVCPPGAIFVSQTVYDKLQDLYEFERVGIDNNSSLVIWRFKFRG